LGEKTWVVGQNLGPRCAAVDKISRGIVRCALTAIAELLFILHILINFSNTVKISHSVRL